MSQIKINKEDVVRVREQLINERKKPTIQALRAALGNQGSWTTIQQFKKQLDDEERAGKDSPEALQAFRALWVLSMQEGRSQRNNEVEDLEVTVAVLTSEVKRMEGEAVAFRTERTELSGKIQETERKLNDVNNELSKARNASESSATKLIEGMERHTQEIEVARGQLAKERARVHKLELELVRTQTRLEINMKQMTLPADIDSA